MKKRNAFLAATLSAAMAFSAAPAAVAETANDESASISEDGTTNTGTDAGTTNNGNDGTDSDNGGKKKDKDTSGGKKKDKEDEDDSQSLDPNKPMWDKNGASSNPAPEGPFKRDGMNRISAYFQSNHFKMISMIVSVIAGVITVGSQLAAMVISVSPTAKAQFDNFIKQLG